MSRSVTSVRGGSGADAGDAGAAPTGGDHEARARQQLRVRRRRLLFGLLLLAALLAGSVLLSLAVGSRPMSLGEVWHAVLDPSGGQNAIVVWSLRLPRTVLGVLVGVALGMAGALMQGHTRNPIADPGILGVSQGAALAVVLAIYAFGIGTLNGFVWFGFAGAVIGAAAVFVIGAAGRGAPTPVTLALAGAALSALLQAFTSALVLLDAQSMDAYRFWKVGSLAGRDASLAGQVLPFLLLGIVLALANAPGLNALSLGEDTARSLGSRVALCRVTGVAAIAVLVGAAVAACGPISFIGLVVPHVARYFTGSDHRWLLPFAGLIGACLLLLADVAGRVVARPGELQVGVMLAVLGAPFFIWLVRRKRMVRL